MVFSSAILCWWDRQATQLTFFVQNFMDASELKQERIDACSFMVMTAEGPVSMCQHNASRDDYILKPLQITRADGSSIEYQPLKNRGENTPPTDGSNNKLSTIPIQIASNEA